MLLKSTKKLERTIHWSDALLVLRPKTISASVRHCVKHGSVRDAVRRFTMSATLANNLMGASQTVPAWWVVDTRRRFLVRGMCGATSLSLLSSSSSSWCLGDEPAVATAFGSTTLTSAACKCLHTLHNNSLPRRVRASPRLAKAGQSQFTCHVAGWCAVPRADKW